MDENVCAEKMRRVDECLLANKNSIKGHEARILKLERSDAVNTEALDNLCKQISGQTKAIWGLVSSIFMLLSGFFIWYVQKIPH